jgi:hypothetical protein
LVDDETSQVTAAHFRLEPEESAGYLRLFRQQVTTHGIPLSIYRDQHGTMQRNDKHWSLQEEPAGRQFPTQVGRTFGELGIQNITAKMCRHAAACSAASNRSVPHYRVTVGPSGRLIGVNSTCTSR